MKKPTIFQMIYVTTLVVMIFDWIKYDALDPGWLCALAILSVGETIRGNAFVIVVPKKDDTK